MSSKTSIPSANWLALQKTLKKPNSFSTPTPDSRKRRKIVHGDRTTASPSPARSTSLMIGIVTFKSECNDHKAAEGGRMKATANTLTATATTTIPPSDTESINYYDTPNSLPYLRKMVAGKINYTSSQTNPGQYLAIDCEMVGVGIDGAESSLARVSVVNWHGAVQLDVFVRQKERVVDYRTRWSGIRESDMIKAKPFEEVQKEVADFLVGKILIGHAVHNDLKALLLSHPRAHIRDTQIYARKHNLTKSKRIALRVLVQQQLGIMIQTGEHNSITDARAAMAVYRLHKKEWEKGTKPPLVKPPVPVDGVGLTHGKKRKREDIEVKNKVGSRPAGEDNLPQAEPRKAKPRVGKNISSGLATVLERKTKDGSKRTEAMFGVGKETVKVIGKVKGSDKKHAWWAELPSAGSKGSVRTSSAS